MANYLTTDTDLTAVANAIRTKGGTSGQLAFPQGFVDAIDAIETGGGDSDATLITKTITENGTYAASDDNADGYSSVTVRVQGSGGSIPGVSLIQQITLTENTRAVQFDVPNGYDWMYLFVNGAFEQENWVYTDINGSAITPYSAKMSTIRLGWSFAITADAEKLYYFAPSAFANSRMTSSNSTLPFNTVRVRGYSADFVAGTKLLMFGGKYADM